MAELLVEKIGFDAIKAKVKNPTPDSGLPVYGGCQTNHPFGIAGESLENPG
jgi:heterodisulfide reductase subunit B